MVFVISNLLKATASILDMVLSLYMWMIIIAALLTWVNPDPYNPIVRFLYQVTEPLLRRIRRILPIGGYGIDFSPLVAIFAIMFLRQFLVKTLFEFATRMGGF